MVLFREGITEHVVDVMNSLFDTVFTPFGRGLYGWFRLPTHGDSRFEVVQQGSLGTKQLLACDAVLVHASTAVHLRQDAEVASDFNSSHGHHDDALLLAIASNFSLPATNSLLWHAEATLEVLVVERLTLRLMLAFERLAHHLDERLSGFHGVLAVHLFHLLANRFPQGVLQTHGAFVDFSQTIELLLRCRVQTSGGHVTAIGANVCVDVLIVANSLVGCGFATISGLASICVHDVLRRGGDPAGVTVQFALVGVQQHLASSTIIARLFFFLHVYLIH